MLRGFAVLCLFFALASAGSAAGATLFVPDTHATIQDAIAAAAAGDRIVVRPGTYVENIDFLGKALTLISEKGPVLTRIDGGQAGPVVTLQNGEGPDSILDGFSITNGHSSDGGGIYCDSASPTVRNNRIHGNSVTKGSGGGIFCSGSQMVISGNEIFGNSGSYGGGGIYCHRSDAVVTGNIVRDNSGCNSYGGGIYCYWCDPVIRDNVFTGNTTAKWGGGIFLDISNAEITGNIVIGNSASLGGGIDCYDRCDPRITNNTVVANSASDEGGGLHCHRTCAISVVNTILWDNDAPLGREIHVGDTASPCTLSIAHSDVEGGSDSAHVEPGCTLNWGAGMIDADPVFAESVAGDVHILLNSPCRDRGDDAAAGLPAADFEGDPRQTQQGVDIGADEFHPHLYFVGTPLPGATLSLRVIGPAGAPVRLLLSDGIQDPPQPTVYGDLYLQTPFTGNWTLPAIGKEGLTTITATVPAAWASGDVHPFQAWVGAWGGFPSRFTNLFSLSIVD
jgi:hypothetical protein